MLRRSISETTETINRIPDVIFSYFNRNAVHEEKCFGMPLDQVVEIGYQIDLNIAAVASGQVILRQTEIDLHDSTGRQS